MIVAGIDLSLAATGIATGRGTAVIEPKTRRGVERLIWIRDEVMTAIGFTNLVMLEDLPIGARNNAAGPLGMIHGVLRVVLEEDGTRFVVVPPASLKKYACGKGNATKADMRMELFKRTELDIRDDNAVDAWWLRAMGLDHLGEAIVVLPSTHRVALEKIDWGDS